MNHAILMGIINGTANRGEELQDNMRLRNMPLARVCMEIGCQRLPFNIIHNHVGKGSSTISCVGCLRNLKVVYLDDIGVMETSDKLRLALKTCREIGIIA